MVCSTSATTSDAKGGTSLQRRTICGIDAREGVRALGTALHDKLGQCSSTAKRVIEFLLGRKPPSLLAEQESLAEQRTAGSKTEGGTPVMQAEDGKRLPPQASGQADKPQLIPEVPKRHINVWEHPYHRIAVAFGYSYQSLVSKGKIDYFLYTHPVGHNLEFAKSPAESGDCEWKHIRWQPFLRKEGQDTASLISYLLGRHDLKISTDSPAACEFLTFA